MNRRDFFKTSGTTGGLLLLLNAPASAEAAAAPGPRNELVEIPARAFTSPTGWPDLNTFVLFRRALSLPAIDCPRGGEARSRSRFPRRSAPTFRRRTDPAIPTRVL